MKINHFSDSTHKPFTLALILCLSFGIRHLPAQNFSQIGPKVPASDQTNLQSLPPAERERREHKSQEVFVDHLNGVVFVSRVEEVKPGGVSASEAVNPGHVALLSKPDFARVIQPFIGKPVSLDSLDRLTSAVVEYCRAHDRPIVNVFVPEQNITNGFVQVVVVQGTVERVQSTGARWFSNDSAQKELRLKPGDTISNRSVLSDLDWMNRNPFHLSNVIYGAGLAPGTTEVTLNTEDRFPARFYTGYEDSGNQYTGFDRYYAGFNWGDAFHLGQDQQLNYQYETSSDFSSLHAHSASYVIPLPWRHVLTIFGDYEDSKGTVPPAEGLTGSNYQISFRYGIPLPAYRSDAVTVRQNFTLGFDNKFNKNSLVFNSVSLGNTTYEVDQFIVGYDFAEADHYGTTSMTETLTESPGGFDGYNSDAYFAAAHPLAQASYLYNTVSMERDTILPENFTLVLRGTVQNSSGNLAPSEQLGVGGYNTVRGYDDREVNGDEGFIFNTEIRTPSISFGDWVGAKKIWNDQMQFLGFWDYGVAGNHQLLPGEVDHTNLSSVGVGFRYNVGNYLSVRFDYGFQLLRTGFDSQHGSRANVGVTLSY